MKITPRKIFELCGSMAVFEKGERYFVTGRVKNLKVNKINSFEEYIEAKVKGTHVYNVGIWTEDEKVVQAVCDCPAYVRYNGFCKHVAAVLFEFCDAEEETKNNNVSAKNSSPEMNRILNNYRSELGGEAATLDFAKLYPTFHILGANDCRVEFRLGLHKKYVIKDLCEFAKNVEECAEATYGKNTAFLHTKKAFLGESRKYLDFILKTAKENKFFNNAFNKYYYMAELKVRTLFLSPVFIDEFFEAATGDTIELCLNFEPQRVEVVDKNPTIRIKFSKEENFVSLEQEEYVYILGEERIYIIKDKKIFCCDKDFSKKMRGFIGCNNAVRAERDFVISNNDMKFFYNRIIPQISEYISVAGGEFLSEFEVAKPKIKFFVDCPEVSYITARCEIDYGDGAENPFLDLKRSGYKDDEVENEVKNALMRYFPVNDGGIFKIKDNDDLVFDFATEGIAVLEELGEVFVSQGFERLKIRPQPNISVGLSIKSDILKLEFSSEDFDLKELKRLLKSYRKKIKYHRLKDGSFLRLDDDEGITKIAEAADALDLFEKSGAKTGGDGGFELPKYRALYLDKVFSGWSGTSRDQRFKSLIRDIKTAEDSDFEIPAELKSVLRSYQRHGFRWLKTMDKCGFGGILADDMGLGKTLQVITLLLYEQQNAPNNNEFSALSLIVCPASLVYNWESEIEHFAPTLNSVVVTGTAKEREYILKNLPQNSVVITSYDLLKRDEEFYEGLKFRYQIIDEAQYIKNSSTKGAQAVKKINASTRFALTGTPVENRLSELWSIFDYLMPGYLFAYSRFKTELEAPALKDGDEGKLNRIKTMVAPFILRRLKGDVLKELPEKTENVFMCRLEGEQRLAYAATVKELKDSLEKSSVKEEGAIKILAMLTKLRQLCCDPHLCYENYGGGSAKLESAVLLVKNAIEGGHKVLLFSQFTSMLEIIEKRLDNEEIKYYTLTGSTSKEERLRLVNNFQNDQTPVFLISLKAGGTGLNLTAADVVIHFAPWWNVAAQNQATDRTHRIGQKKAVTVYKLIAKNTVEEKILKLQESKKELADAVITGENISLSKMSKEELLDLFGVEDE